MGIFGGNMGQVWRQWRLAVDNLGEQRIQEESRARGRGGNRKADLGDRGGNRWAGLVVRGGNRWAGLGAWEVIGGQAWGHGR